MPETIVYAPNTYREVNPAEDPTPDELRRLGVDRQLRVPVGQPRISLAVWLLEPRRPLRGTILVLHGVHGNKDSLLYMGHLLADAGFRAVLVDLRGHGRSTGAWLTYGVRESADLSELVDALARQDLLAGCLGTFGISYGGAVAIQHAGRDARVKAVVAVAPFATMRSEVRHFVRRRTLFGPFLTEAKIDAAIDGAGRLADFDPDDASPVKAITQTQAPVLLFHGGRDVKIPCQQSAQLHAAAPGHSELIIVAGADHDSISDARASPVFTNAVAWFERQLPVSCPAAGK
ncbi:MAG TPA: alpha/beta fold hydrolase [Verrucomicrobiae bacterium]|nr:alpha/beta fold hydrolase [Verrucomicrobiae bacterium]